MNVFITGGAGFIGSNLSKFHLDKGDTVFIYDNLTRPGSILNLKWLESFNNNKLNFILGDIRDYSKLEKSLSLCSSIERVYHLAAQVAVTTSIEDPRNDFDINALGTFNVLEAVRKCNPDAIVIYSSTNKVYGDLDDLNVLEGDTRYYFENLPNGVPETRHVDLYSPYGCSKGSGDLYVKDYNRSFGLKTVVFRQSCIYGTRQFGIEDQGWVAHFCISAALGKKISIFGDGKQVRDLLWVDDLINAYDKACINIDTTQGQVYNIGGGSNNTISIWCELSNILKDVVGYIPDIQYNESRLGDQKVFVCDIQKLNTELNWQPKISCKQGIEILYKWIVDNKELFI